MRSWMLWSKVKNKAFNFFSEYELNGVIGDQKLNIVDCNKTTKLKKKGSL